MTLNCTIDFQPGSPIAFLMEKSWKNTGRFFVTLARSTCH